MSPRDSGHAHAARLVLSFLFVLLFCAYIIVDALRYGRFVPTASACVLALSAAVCLGWGQATRHRRCLDAPAHSLQLLSYCAAIAAIRGVFASRPGLFLELAGTAAAALGGSLCLELSLKWPGPSGAKPTYTQANGNNTPPRDGDNASRSRLNRTRVGVLAAMLTLLSWSGLAPAWPGAPGFGAQEVWIVSPRVAKSAFIAAPLFLLIAAAVRVFRQPALEAAIDRARNTWSAAALLPSALAGSSIALLWLGAQLVDPGSGQVLASKLGTPFVQMGLALALPWLVGLTHAGAQRQGLDKLKPFLWHSFLVTLTLIAGAALWTGIWLPRSFSPESVSAEWSQRPWSTQTASKPLLQPWTTAPTPNAVDALVQSLGSPAASGLQAFTIAVLGVIALRGVAYAAPRLAKLASPAEASFLSAVAAARIRRSYKDFEDLAESVLLPFRCAVAPRASAPHLFISDPPLHAFLGPAGTVEVRRESLPPALAKALCQQPTEAIESARLARWAVRLPKVRPLLADLASLRASIALPIGEGGELEGCLLLPSSMRAPKLHRTLGGRIFAKKAAELREARVTEDQAEAGHPLAWRRPRGRLLSWAESLALAELADDLCVHLSTLCAVLRARNTCSELGRRHLTLVQQTEDRTAEAFQARLQRDALATLGSEHRETLANNAFASPVGRAFLRRLEQLAAQDPMPIFVECPFGISPLDALQRIHRASGRGKGLCLCLRLASLPPELIASKLFGIPTANRPQEPLSSYIDLAADGTLGLDGMSLLDAATQRAVVDMLSTSRFPALSHRSGQLVQARIVFISTLPLEELRSRGSVSPELEQWLAPHQLQVPPLAERRDEIGPLVLAELARMCRQLARPPMGIAPEALERLSRWPWHGNDRELQLFVHEAVMTCRGPRLSLRNIAAFESRSRPPRPELFGLPLHGGERAKRAFAAPGLSHLDGPASVSSDAAPPPRDDATHISPWAPHSAMAAEATTPLSPPMTLNPEVQWAGEFADFERSLLFSALASAGGDDRRAAKALGLRLVNFRQKLKKYGA